jgi:predicted nucleic acid-binding protein
MATIQELIAMARRRTKAEALTAIRAALERDPAPGADRESILSALRDMRGE